MFTFGACTFVRSPLVSFLYERGWRQNFNQSGFPGPDEEVCLPWLLALVQMHQFL